METERPTALPRPLERLALSLAAAQDMADSGFYPAAFGYLEEAVQIALAAYREPGPTRSTAEADAAEGERLLAFDAADVWRGVASSPLF
jgi:hypothetical protein